MEPREWLDAVGIGRPLPKKPVRWLEIVTAHCIVIAVIVGIGFVWARYAN